MTEISQPSTRELRFSAAAERAFQDECYLKGRGFLRAVATLFFLMGLGHAFNFALTQPGPFLAIPLAVMVGWGLIFSLTFWDGFRRRWQPVLTALLLFGMSILQTGAALNIRVEPGYGDLIARVSWFSAASMMIMVSIAPLRLNFRYAVVLYSGLTIHCTVMCLVYYGAPLSLVLDRFSRGVLVVYPTLLYLAYMHEKLHRDAFLSRWYLAEKEAEERSRREKTESMLKVLSNAIGGIVHDLGTPLTAVQGHAELMTMAIDRGRTQPEMLRQIAGGILDGARMMNYLRTSLIEQTRVLENKPIPVVLKPVPIAFIVEAGVRFQKPMFAANRRLTTAGEQVEVLADEMKLIAVFMNLIGNALKYSDGAIHISWRAQDENLLVAVQDQGTSGHGLTRGEAGRLFVAFSRLEKHAATEGTGLGLLSVQRILEAHGGGVYIEGRNQETGELFSTATADYPSMLDPDFATAFVLVIERCVQPDVPSLLQEVTPTLDPSAPYIVDHELAARASFSQVC